MYFGKINQQSLLQHDSFWSQLLEELSLLDSSSRLGTRHFDYEGFFLNVHTYKTVKRCDCRFEAHHETIDLQYVISGGELIEWVDSGILKEDGPYEKDADKQWFSRPDSPVLDQIHLRAGHYAIFFPGEAHCPQISDKIHEGVYKAVVKIPFELWRHSGKDR